MKKFTTLLSALLIFTMIFSACSKDTADKDLKIQTNSESNALNENNSDTENNSTENDATDDTTITTLRVGMMSSYDVIPFVMMNETKIAEKYGIDLVLETFTSAKERDAAFVAGELDGVIADPVAIAIYQNADFDVRITGITDGDYVLMANKDSGITSLSDLPGHSIAISENTLIDYTLDYILKSQTMDTGSLKKEIVPRIPDRLELLRSGQVDLGLLPEPFASIALNDGAIYIGSANDLGLYPAISAFSMDAISSKEEAIANLYKAYNETVEYLNKTDISSYEDIVIQTVGYPEEMAGQIVMEPFRPSTLPSKEMIEDIIEWSVNRDLTKPDLTYDQIVYDVYNK